jgi:hypothetical protein
MMVSKATTIVGSEDLAGDRGEGSTDHGFCMGKAWDERGDDGELT